MLNLTIQVSSYNHGCSSVNQFFDPRSTKGAHLEKAWARETCVCRSQRWFWMVGSWSFISGMESSLSSWEQLRKILTKLQRSVNPCLLCFLSFLNLFAGRSVCQTMCSLSMLLVWFQEWTREEKNKCLKETENSFKYSGKILRLIATSKWRPPKYNYT